jgi:hypothetical protein
MNHAWRVRRKAQSEWIAWSLDGAELGKQPIVGRGPGDIMDVISQARADLVATLVALANSRNLTIVSVVEVYDDELLMFLHE